MLSLLGLPADASVGLRHRRADGERRPAWPWRATGVLGAPGWDAARAGPDRRAAADRDRRRGGARDDLQRAADDRARQRARALVAADDAGRDAIPTRSRALSRDRRPGDRVRAGGQREHRRVRSAGDDRAGASRRARGCTSTARSGSGRRPRRLARTCVAASSAPTPGPPTPTSGSTSPTTAGWRSSPTAPPIARAMGALRRVPRRRRPTRQLRLHARGLAAGARVRASTPRCASSGGPASLRCRSLLRVTLRCSLRCCARAAPRCSTTWCSIRCCRVPAGGGRAGPGGRHVLGRRRRSGDGREAMRISVSGWQTSVADVERSAASILAALR